ncbi:hypothetical protein MMC31_007651 [Peltigera leucophlebia]|nr:hypothetical protein [Peltigera leucophlebia]
MPVASDTHSSQTSPHNRQPLAPRSEALVLAESQWLFTEADLLRTPSIIENGMTPEKEAENRGKGVNFITQVGIMLQLPQLTLATASVFLHRFFMRHPIQDVPDRPGYHYYTMAATSLFLATKVEENCRKMKDLVVACVRVAQKDPYKAVDEQDKEYWRWKDNILLNEEILLEAICFDLSLEPPYKILFDLLAIFGEQDNKRLRNAAWAFVSDSCLSMLCLLFPSRTIAASALYAAAKHCDVSFPDDDKGNPWWDTAGVDLKHIRKAINFMAGVYESTPLRGSRDSAKYERTPEDGDEANAKTRQKAGGDTILDDGGESRRSSIPTSDADKRGTKRSRQDIDRGENKRAINGANGNHVNGNSQPVASNETTKETRAVSVSEGHIKRQRFNGDEIIPNGSVTHSEVLKNTATNSEPPVEDVSEEGEVES